MQGAEKSKLSATGGHGTLVMLEAIVENMNLVILNISFPSFLHEQWRAPSRSW